MTIPTKMPSPRQQIHIRFCKDLGACKYIGGAGSRTECGKLDELLDFNDEMLLHAKVRELYNKWTALPLRGRGTIGPGVLWLVDELDPFTKIDEFTDDPEEFVHPGEDRPDCPGCAAGKKHYHRKKDGSMVKSPSV